MIPEHTYLRAAAVLGTIAAIFLTGAQTHSQEKWNMFVYILGFVHYFSALYYSKKQIQQTFRQHYFYAKAAGVLSIAGVFLYVHWLPLVYYFGVHHAYNEAYQRDTITGAKDGPEARSLRAASALLFLIVYFFLLRDDPNLTALPERLLAAAIPVCYVIFFYSLWRARHVLTRAELVDNCAMEVASLVVVGLSLYFNFTVQFFFIVVYHFIYWGLRPLPRLLKTDLSGLFRYLGISGLLYGAVFLMSPYGLKPLSLEPDFFYSQFIFWAYLHITLSFVVSDFFPNWIVHFFRPPQLMHNPRR